jgi:hypothetical protein
MFLFLATMAIGEGGPPNPWRQPWKVNAELHLFLAIWLGYALGWKWEGLGGTMIVAGVTTFLALEGHMPDLMGVLLILPGLGYLSSWMVARRHGRPRPPATPSQTVHIP